MNVLPLTSSPPGLQRAPPSLTIAISARCNMQAAHAHSRSTARNKCKGQNKSTACTWRHSTWESLEHHAPAAIEVAAPGQLDRPADQRLGRRQQGRVAQHGGQRAAHDRRVELAIHHYQLAVHEGEA